VDGLKKIAAEAGETPARVALAWVCGRPGVTSTLMGVSRAEQVEDNAAALDIVLSSEQRETLDLLSAPADPRTLYSLFTPIPRQYEVFGGASVSV
jgi:aryl-alcohol dehydrogenase-like predicted oxidoreductase